MPSVSPPSVHGYAQVHIHVRIYIYIYIYIYDCVTFLLCDPPCFVNHSADIQDLMNIGINKDIEMVLLF